MARDPRNFKLGVFVIAGITLTLLAALVLLGGEWFRQKHPVYFYFAENVTGLEAGSDIKYRGVMVGKVTKVALQPRTVAGRERIGGQALIKVDAEVYPDRLGVKDALIGGQEDVQRIIERLVARGLRVTIAWKDITAQKYLNLDFHPDFEQLEMPDLTGVDPQHPYIPAVIEPSLTDIQRDLATTLAKLANVDYELISVRLVDLLELTTQRMQAFDTQALQGHAEEALIAVREMAQDPALRRVIDRLDTMTENLDDASARIATLFEKPELDQGFEDFGATAAAARRTMEQLEGDVPRLVARVDGLAARLDGMLEETRVPETAGAIRDAATEVGGAARDIGAMREDIRRLTHDFATASRDLGRLARYLEEHPSALLTGKKSGGVE